MLLSQNFSASDELTDASGIDHFICFQIPSSGELWLTVAPLRKKPPPGNSPLAVAVTSQAEMPVVQPAPD